MAVVLEVSASSRGVDAACCSTASSGTLTGAPAAWTATRATRASVNRAIGAAWIARRPCASESSAGTWSTVVTPTRSGKRTSGLHTCTRREQRRKYPNDDVSSDEFAAQREGTARAGGHQPSWVMILTRHPSAFCSHYAGTRLCFSRPQRPRAADGLCARLAPSHAVLRHWCAGRHGVPCLDLQGEGRFDCARCKCRIKTVSNAFLLLLLLTSAHHCADYASWIAHSMR